MYKMYYMYTNTSSGCCRLYTYFCCCRLYTYFCRESFTDFLN